MTISSEDNEEYIVPVFWKQAIGLAGLGVLTVLVHGGPVLFLLAAATFIDTWQSGIYKRRNNKSLLNMSPIGWSFVVAGLFIIGYPMYLINRNKLKTRENENIFYYAVIILGVILIFTWGSHLVAHFKNSSHI